MYLPFRNQLNHQLRSQHHGGGKSHSGKSHYYQINHQLQQHENHHHQEHHYQDSHHHHTGHNHHGYPSNSGTGLGALGSLLGMGLSYLGTGLLNGAASAAGGYGGYGAYGALPPNPNPGPYGFGPGIAAGYYGHPVAAPAPYPGLNPTNYGGYQPYPNFSGGGYGTWSPSEYGIPR